jgi:nucleoside-diphosphate-sugar epimerase
LPRSGLTLPYFENFFLVEEVGKELTRKAVDVYRATPGLGLVNTCLLERHGNDRRLIIRIPLGDAPWPMVALDDIGWFAAHVFANPDMWGGRTLNIGSEALRMADLVKIFTNVTGIPAIYEPGSLEEYRALPMPEAEDIAAMYEFAQFFGMPREYKFLRKLHPGLMTFEAWLRKMNWRGESRV